MDGFISAEVERPVARRWRIRHPLRWLALLFVLVLLGLVAATWAATWLRSDAGRQAIAREVESVLSDEIRGSVTIGTIDEISSEGVVGRNIRFLDESGRLVLQADHADLDVTWSELLSGHFVSPHGRVRGARVVLETLPSGTLLIDRAFESAHPGPAGQPLGSDIVRLAGLVVSDLEVLLRIHGAPDIRARNVSAICLVHAPENGGGHLRADRIDGHMRIASPIPIDLDISDGTLSLDGDSARRVVISLPTRVNGENVQVNVRVRADAAENVHVAVNLTPSGFGAAIVSLPLVLQALAAGELCNVLDVSVDLPNL